MDVTAESRLDRGLAQLSLTLAVNATPTCADVAAGAAIPAVGVQVDTTLGQHVPRLQGHTSQSEHSQREPMLGTFWVLFALEARHELGGQLVEGGARVESQRASGRVGLVDADFEAAVQELQTSPKAKTPKRSKR